jgi:hypothetical protein
LTPKCRRLQTGQRVNSERVAGSSPYEGLQIPGLLGSYPVVGEAALEEGESLLAGRPRAAREAHRIVVASEDVTSNVLDQRAVDADQGDKEFAYTPVGTVEPNGQQVQWELINIFRYTDEGRLVEEWVQTDTYEFLRQLGAVAR